MGYKRALRYKLPGETELGDELMVKIKDDGIQVFMLRPLIKDFSDLNIDLTCGCVGCHIWRECRRILLKYMPSKKTQDLV